MAFDGREKKEVKGQSCQYVTLVCPKRTCPIRKVSFRANRAYQIPSSRLLSCYGMGKTMVEQNALIQAMYFEDVEDSRAAGGTVSAHFKRDALSDRENVINCHVRLVILEGAPFSIVKSREYRRFNRLQVEASI